jgi:hypothetical protein
MEGDTVALKLCLERVYPVRRRNSTPIDLPPIQGASDLLPAINTITSAVASGALDLDAAAALSGPIEAKRKVIETTDWPIEVREFSREKSAIDWPGFLFTVRGEFPTLFGGDAGPRGSVGAPELDQLFASWTRISVSRVRETQ